jgi:hypothetical protein
MAGTSVTSERLSQKRERRIALESCLEPYAYPLQELQSILLVRRRLHFAALLFITHMLLFRFHNSKYSFFSHVTWWALIIVVLNLIRQKIALPWHILFPPLTESTDKTSPTEARRQIRSLSDLAAIYVNMEYEIRDCCDSFKVEYSRNPIGITVQAAGIFFVVSILAMIFSDFALVYLAVMTSLLAPLIYIHDLHITAWKAARPYVRTAALEGKKYWDIVARELNARLANVKIPGMSAPAKVASKQE